MSEWDDEGDRGSQTRGTPRPFAKTLHDFSLRVVQRAGRYVVEDHDGVVRYSNAAALDRNKRDFDREYDVLYDIFEQKVSWMRRTLIMTVDAAGDWELALLVKGGWVVVAYGHLERSEVVTMGQDVPAFRVADLFGLLRRLHAQIRLRREYQQLLS